MLYRTKPTTVMLFLIAVVGFVALSIFMPILSLMSNIK